jgi:tetratricopeptide (TPR) repeat protein
VDETLETRLSRGRLPTAAAVDVALAVARELSDAHARGVVHGDLSPSSIRFGVDGTATIADLPRSRRITQELNPGGNPTLAALEDLAQNRSHIRKADVLMGALAYKSPEQVRGDVNDATDDVFALGALLYEMLSGRRAFPGTSRSELTREIVLAKPSPLGDDVPPALARVVEKALATKRADRYQSAAAVVTDLEKARPEPAKPAPAKRPTMRAPPPVAPRKGMSFSLVASVVAVVAGAIAVGLYVRRSGKRPDEHTVLVAPMEVRGQTEGTAYLGRAFAEAMAVNLALGGSIKVLPVPDQAELGAGAMDRAKAARDHGAGRMLTGAVTRNGEQLVANINLIDTVENRIIWGTQSQSPNNDLSAVALELSRDVAEHMGASLPRLYDYIGNLTGSPAMSRSPDTGQALGAIRTGDVPRALDATSRLVIAFPSELAAHALRCQALLLAWDADPSFDNGQRLRQAMDALEAIDPKNPYSAFYRAYLAYGRGDMKTALDLFAGIVERDDLSPAARAWVMRYRALALGVTGDKARSLAVLEEALSIDPANAWTVASLSESLGELDRPHDALERAQQAVALNPSSWRNYVTLGLSYGRLAKFDEASKAFTTGCQMSKAQFACALQAVALQHAGKSAEATTAAEHASKLTDSTWGTYNLACYYAIAGDSKKAISYLSRSVDLGFPNTSFETDPDFKSLQGSTDLQKLSMLVKQRTGQQ